MGNSLYLISQGENNGYDTYDSAVVVAGSGEESMLIHPDSTYTYTDRGWSREGWGGEPIVYDSGAWVPHKNVDKVDVQYLGPTELEAGTVVCASFNAG